MFSMKDPIKTDPKAFLLVKMENWATKDQLQAETRRILQREATCFV